MNVRPEFEIEFLFAQREATLKVTSHYVGERGVHNHRLEFAACESQGSMMVAGASDKGSIYLIDIQKLEPASQPSGIVERIKVGPSKAPKFKPSFDRPGTE